MSVKSLIQWIVRAKLPAEAGKERDFIPASPVRFKVVEEVPDEA
jgi:hypothetical protein